MQSEECDFGQLNSEGGHDRDHACSSTCKVRPLWHCQDNTCELLCGNGRLDPTEECDYLQQPHEGMSPQGYIKRAETWHDDPETNHGINLGCTDHCTVKPGYVCPLSDDTSLLCTNTCHDGIYDGIHMANAAPNNRLLAEQCDTGN